MAHNVDPRGGVFTNARLLGSDTTLAFVLGTIIGIVFALACVFFFNTSTNGGAIVGIISGFTAFVVISVRLAARQRKKALISEKARANDRAKKEAATLRKIEEMHAKDAKDCNVPGCR